MFSSCMSLIRDDVETHHYLRAKQLEQGMYMGVTDDQDPIAPVINLPPPPPMFTPLPPPRTILSGPPISQCIYPPAFSSFLGMMDERLSKENDDEVKEPQIPTLELDEDEQKPRLSITLDDEDEDHHILLDKEGKTRAITQQVTVLPTPPPLLIQSNLELFKQKYEIFSTLLGSGTFGIVFKGRCEATNEYVAIKHAFYKHCNREVEILPRLHHKNVIRSFDSFVYRDPLEKHDACYLVLEYVQGGSLHHYIKRYRQRQRQVPIHLRKIWMFQLLKGMVHVHGNNVMHRDLKPPNCLINGETNEFKVCDFGSAKALPDDKHINYICSRFYRPPELLLASSHYDTSIDLWSIGCIMGEMIRGEPLFTGDTSMDMMIQIQNVLGKVGSAEAASMRLDDPFIFHHLPQVLPNNRRSWSNLLGLGHANDAFDPEIVLLRKFLRYNPQTRITALEALADPYFDELKSPHAQWNCRMPDHMFQFSDDEIQMMLKSQLYHKIVPSYIREKQARRI